MAAYRYGRAAPTAVTAIRMRRKQVAEARLRLHLAPSWRELFHLDHGRPWSHRDSRELLLPYCV